MYPRFHCLVRSYPEISGFSIWMLIVVEYIRLILQCFV
jgi:hypothetical protein